MPVSENNKKNVYDVIREEAISAKIKLGFSIKSFLAKIIPLLLLSIDSIYILSRINGKKVYLGHLFMYNLFTPWLLLVVSFIIFFLVKASFGKGKVLLFGILTLSAMGISAYFSRRVMIPPEVLNNVLYVSAALGFFGTLYYIIYAKSGYVAANPRNFEISEGVFNRNRNNTIMNEVKDHDMYQSFSDLCLGLAKIRVHLKGSVKNNFWVYHLTKGDAEELLNYLKTHAHASYVEYRDSMDRAKNTLQNKGPTPSKKDRSGGLIDDNEMDGEY